MNRLDIEAWAYRIVELAERGQPIEDNAVELKANFPDAQDVARQLAGHANAALGEEILWLFGVDEKRGVIDVTLRDLASWRGELEAEFEGGAPTIQQFTLQKNDKPFAALVFQTDAPPYVVRNPKRKEKGGGGPFELEVPWRDGRTRSARRAELVRMLRPIALLPVVEPVAGVVKLQRDGTIFYNVIFYLSSASLERIVIPRATGTLDLGIAKFELSNFNVNPDGRDPDVIASRSHVTVNGAGRISCNGVTSASPEADYGPTARFEVSFRIATAQRDVLGLAVLDRVEPEVPKTVALWRFGPSSA